MSYTLKSVSFEGDNFLQLLAVDDAGLIVGYHGEDPGMGGANPNIGETLLPPYDIDQFTPLNFPASAQTQVIGINNENVVVGFWVADLGATSTQHGFIDNNGTFATIDKLVSGTPEPITNLLGVNNSGTEVGFYQDGAGNQHAFVVTGGSITEVVGNVGTFTGATITDLVVTNGTVATVNSTAAAINNEGTVVGFFTDANGINAGFEETSPGDFTTVVVPGATITQVLGINDVGVMVGDFTDSSGVMHGFVDNNGTFTTIDGPGATATTLNGINDFGEVTGFYTDASNDTVGLVGLPVGGTISLTTLELGTTGGLYMVQGAANAEAGAITGSGALTIEIAPGASGPAAASFTTASPAYAAPVTLSGVTVDAAAAMALGTGTVDFASGAASTLKLEAAAQPFANTISDFGFGDTIDLVGVSASAADATLGAGGTLAIPGTAVTLNFNTADTPVGTVLTLAPDGAGGTALTMNAPHQYLAATVDFTGDVFTQLLGVDNAGTVVGYHGDGTVNPNVGLVLPPPSLAADFVVTDFPGAVQTQIVGINNSGMEVGFYIDGSGINHGFIDNAGTFTTVDDSPGGTTEPINQLLSINNVGEAAGYFQDGTGDQHPYVVSHGTFTTLAVPGISPSIGGQATAINDAGVIAGFFTDAGGVQHGFVDNAGTFATIDVPGATSTQILGMNNGGVMVGDFVDAGGVMHGFVDDQGVFTTVDGPGAVSTVLNGINDFGQIAGFYATDATGTTDNGLILTPTGDASAPLTIGAVDLATAGGLYSVAGADNTIAGPISGTGTLALQPAAGSVGADSVTITSSGNAFGGTSLGGVTLDLAASGGLGSGAITFTQGAALLRIEAPGAFTNTLADFNATDAVDLNGIVAAGSSATLANGGTLSIPEAGAGTLTLTFDPASNPAGTVFALNSDNEGGTTVTLARDYTLQVRNDPGDPTFNQLLGIDNAGTIAGYYGVGGGDTINLNVGRLLAPPYGNGDFTTLNTPAQTQVFELNTSGTAVGFFANADNSVNSGFLENGGTFVTVADTPVAGVVVNQLLGENNLGVAAGYWQDPTATNGVFLTHGYTVSGGVDTGGTLTGATFTPIAPSGAISEQATGVNDSGEVVGFFTDNTAAAVVHGFTDIGGVFATIDAPGATSTQILGVNDAGVVVGDFTDASGNMHGFVDDHGAFTVVDGTNSTLTTVNGINDFNEIVGFAVDNTSGNTTGFIGTPNGGGGFTNLVSGTVTLGAAGGLEYLQGTNNVISASITGAGLLTLELAPGVSAASVTFTGTSTDGGGISIGGGITADLAAAGAGTTGNVAFNGAGDLIIETVDAAFANPITHFSPGATLDLRGLLTGASHATVATGGVLSIPVTGGGTHTLSFPNNVGQVLNLQSDGDGGTEVLACYCAGTRVLTPKGETAVEALRPGDAVIALAGDTASVRRAIWIGHSTVDLDRHSRPEQAAPVRIRAGAFGPNMPHRDLLLSLDHSVRVRDAMGEALVPIRLLVNGAGIIHEPARGIVTYLHVELDSHALLLAEGLPAESYLDTGNRAGFANAGQPARSPDREISPAPALLGAG